jgi:hypothetical protein
LIGARRQRHAAVQTDALEEAARISRTHDVGHGETQMPAATTRDMRPKGLAVEDMGGNVNV